MQVSIFTGDYDESLEKAVNSWLKEFAGKVVSTKMTTVLVPRVHEEERCVTTIAIWYEP